jgi:hypothetical protein
MATYTTHSGKPSIIVPEWLFVGVQAAQQRCARPARQHHQAEQQMRQGGRAWRLIRSVTGARSEKVNDDVAAAAPGTMA